MAIAQPKKLVHVDSLSHEGTVIVFGEDRPKDPNTQQEDPKLRKLWYKILDLAQTDGRDQPGAWEDSTHWTRWYEVPFPAELRAAGMSLLNVKRRVDHQTALFPGCWKVISKDGFIYLYRALDLTSLSTSSAPNEAGEVTSEIAGEVTSEITSEVTSEVTVRVYANRYTLPRELSPDGGDSKGTAGEAITVPQLRCAREARYRRSAQRETPASDTDSQGTRDMTREAFEEPTLEFSMLRPHEGHFTVTLTPSNVPGRERWQFFCKSIFQPKAELKAEPNPDSSAEPTDLALELDVLPAPRPAIACYSFLCNDNGWVDLTEKFDQLNTQTDPFSILPDRLAVLVHKTLGDLELSSRPDALTFRLQEHSGGFDDEEARAASPQRVMLSALVSWDESKGQIEKRPGLISLDFPLTDTGAIAIDSEISVEDVSFARTALSLNAPSDRVFLPPPAGKLDNVVRSSDFSIHAWVKHDAGSGTLLRQNLTEGEQPTEENPTGDGWWAIQWDATTQELIATYCAAQTRHIVLRTPAPVSFTWHHIGLVKSGESLALYVNGTQVNSSTDAQSSSDEAINGTIVLGGALRAEDPLWIDYRIDQVILYREAVVASLETLYLELSEEQQQQENILGHWTFDNADADALLKSGADLVTQTAPLFPPEPAAFELGLGEKSVGMGLLHVPAWKMLPGSGPNLFRGADGIVRVYLAAKHQKDDQPSAGTLVYNTTSTRAQFTLPWLSTTEATGTTEATEQTGAVIMQGRKPGPILNRTQLNLEAGSQSDTLTLTISHPYLPDLKTYEEVWHDLPTSLSEFIQVINGTASSEPDAADVLNGDLPYYAYAEKGPYGDRQGPYASELFRAIAPLVSDNGGIPRLQPGVALIRQQGNFTGWTRAPLAVSGRFGTHEMATGSDPTETEKVKVIATATSALAGTLPLRAPGDFAFELWANPKGGTKERQTLMCWHQEKGDGVSLAIAPVDSFAFSDNSIGSSISLAEGMNLLDSGIAFEAQFQIPQGGAGGNAGNLIVVVTNETWELNANSIIDQVLDLRIEQPGLSEEDIAAARAWATAARPDLENPAVTIAGTITVALKVQERRVLVTATQRLADADAGSIADLWLQLVQGESASPAGESWSVKRAIAPEPINAESVLLDTKLVEAEGSDVTVEIIVTPVDEGSSLIELTHDMRPIGSEAICTVNGRELTRQNRPETWMQSGNSVSRGEILLGTDNPNEIPFTGTVKQVSVWGATSTSGLPLVKATPISNNSDASIQITGSLGERTQPVDVTSLESGFKVATSLGDRAFETLTANSATDWLHLAVVCSDNIAIRCTQDGDRAVIKDADGLNPNQALTIDCILVRDDAAQDRWLFSKTNLQGDSSEITFALGITAAGKPRLRYTLEVDGDYQIYDLVGEQSLQVGRPYEIFATVKLAEYFDPPKPIYNSDPKLNKFRNQIWMQHALIAVWDITAANWIGSAPRDFPNSYPEAEKREKSERSADKLLSPIPALIDKNTDEPFFLTPLSAASTSDRTVTLRIADENHTTQAVTFRSTSGLAAIGAYSGEDPKTLEIDDIGYFRGVIGHVRMWTSSLSVAALKLLATQPGQPSGVSKPVAWWQFNENRGLQAQDSQSGAAARLNREQLWAYARETARLSLFLDGRIATLQPSDYKPTYGSHGKLRFGGRETANGGIEVYEGSLDELRLWSDIRSNEELLDSMHLRLSGKEDDLLGYWPISARSGPLIKDEAPGMHHATLVKGETPLTSGDLPLLRQFWTEVGAPVSDDLPQVRHLLGGQKNSYTAYRVGAPSTAAEYSEIQISPTGQLVGAYKRAIAWAETGGLSGFATGFKTGDADLTYIGQAQSAPTLIGYIEGAPPVPSENLTRPYWASDTDYSGYSGNTAVTLETADNTTLTFASDWNQGLGLSTAFKVGAATAVEMEAEAGFSLGAHTALSATLLMADTEFVTAIGSLDSVWSTFKSHEIGIGTSRTLTNTFGLGGRWEGADQVLNHTVGRRYVPDNTGYALVKSGVANVYVMQLRSNGAMLGIQMSPDPDIPEDFNIITFKIREDYTRQGTLDGKIGFVNDPAYPHADQSRGSYFRPREVANLEARIEAYEARLLANYDSFDAENLGRSPFTNEKSVIENGLEIPYNWGESLSKRNIVNTYVWTASGGFFSEELNTSITRTESKGGNYSLSGNLGVGSSGKITVVGVGFHWEAAALFGASLETSVTKTKSEGRDFGLSVDVTCDDLLERYTGDPQQMYSGEAAAGKVNGYRFKSFYLVPDKEHFSTFWDTVVDPDWLEGEDNDARALRQAKGNLNNVWRVLHRVTYVSRVPPKDKKSLGNKGAVTRAVVHEIPNWQVVNLVLDVIRTGVTSQGDRIGISHPRSGTEVARKFIALAVDDVVTYQWAPNAPWWQQTVIEAHPIEAEIIEAEVIEADAIAPDIAPDAEDSPSETETITPEEETTLGELVPTTKAGKTFQNLRTDVYEYMVAYFETGLADNNPRLRNGPAGPDPTEPEDPEVPPLPPITTLEEGAEEALHLYLLNRSWHYQDSRGQDDLNYAWPAELRHDELPTVVPGQPAVQGRLILPGSSIAADGSPRPPERAHLAMSSDWGRLKDWTTELVFRQTQKGPAVLLAPSAYLSEAQKPFHWLCIDNERRDGSLAIFPVGARESVSLPGVNTQSVDKLVYLALSFTHSRPDAETDTVATEAELIVRWSVEGQDQIRTQRLTAVDGDAAGGHLVLGGDGEDLFHFYFARGGFEVLHLALHGIALGDAEVNRRARALGLIR